MNANLVSTRNTGQKPILYGEAIIQGLAPDGGLYTPLEYPQLTLDQIKNLSENYAELSADIQQRFIDEDSIPYTELKQMLSVAYGSANFRPLDEFPNQVTPISKVTDKLYIEELSLGPTAAFKDMAMQSLAPQMDYVLEKQGKQLRILGATSGDTGSAAEHPFIGSQHASVFFISPLTGMSVFQRAQMGKLSGKNIHNISIHGNYDDAQQLVKKLKLTPGFEDLGALNSINWGRIVAQVPYYFSGYRQLVKEDVGMEIDVVVPSGNFGNVLAGHIARSMGLPLHTLVIATNENDVLHRTVQTGIYEEKRAVITSSPSMDISRSSNLERLVFEIFDFKAEPTVEFMKQFEETKRAELPQPDLLKKMNFDSGSSTEQNRLDTIKWVYNETNQGRLIDPHTANGIAVARHYLETQKNEGRPVLALSTALPVKFENTMRQALGFVPLRPPRFENVEDHVTEESFVIIDNDIDQLADYLASNS